MRRLWADRCANIRGGGEGLTPSDARALWADPGYVDKQGSAHKAAMRNPELRAKLSAVQSELQNRPDVIAKNSLAQREAQNRPEVRSQRVAVHKALAQTPERKAQLAKATANNTPEVRARAAATLRANNARRKLAALEQPHEGRADPLLGVHEVRPDALP